MKKLLTLALALCMVLTLGTAFAFSASAADVTRNTYTMTQVYDDGKYSVVLQENADIVTISNANELSLFASYVNSGRTTKGISFRLLADVSLDNQYSTSDLPLFTPIGNTAETKFRGTFNGYGHQIANLYVKNETGAAGLFGYVNSASILNLTLSNVSVSGKSGVGALIGVATGSVDLRNISIDSVNGKVSGEQNVGGLIGDASAASKIRCINAVSSVAVSATGNAGGFIGSVKNAEYINCLMAGRISATANAGVFSGVVSGTATAKKCYFYSTAFEATVPAAGAAGEVTAWDATKTASEAAQELNDYCLNGETLSTSCYAWSTKNNKAVLTNILPEAKVTVNGKIAVFATFAEAAKYAGANDGSVLQPMRGFVVTEATEIGGTYTLDVSKFSINLNAPLTISKGTVTVTGDKSLWATDSIAVLMQGGNLNVASGKILSRDSFAIKNNGKGIIRLYGQANVSGGNEGSIYLSTPKTLFAGNGAATPELYTGTLVRVYCGFAAEDGAVVACDAKEGQFRVTNYDSSKFVAKYENGNMILCKVGYWVWVIIGALFAGAAILLVVTIVKTANFKKRMKNYVFLPFLPSIFFTERQIIFLIAAAAVIFLCLLINLILGSKQKKAEAAAKAAKAEKDATETPAEEPKEEPKAEETPAEEPAAEETTEEPAEEPAAEETTEEPAEEPAVEETTEEPAEEPAEEVQEEAAEESEEEPQIPVVDGNPTIPTAKGDQIVVAERDAAGNMVYSIYKKSFTARLIQSDKEIQERYEIVKNALLSYKKVNSRVSWSYDSFKSGHDQLAKITIRGKTPYLYLALDPDTLGDSKYNVTDAGKAKKYSTVPCRLRLTSKRSVKWATELIDILAEKKGLVKDPKFQPATYVSENETTEALIEKGLIKKAQ